MGMYYPHVLDTSNQHAHRWRAVAKLKTVPAGPVLMMCWQARHNRRGWLHAIIDTGLPGRAPLPGGGAIIFQSERPDWQMLRILTAMGDNTRRALVQKVGSISLAIAADNRFRHLLLDPVTAAVAAYADLPEHITKWGDAGVAGGVRPVAPEASKAADSSDNAP